MFDELLVAVPFDLAGVLVLFAEDRLDLAVVAVDGEVLVADYVAVGTLDVH